MMSNHGDPSTRLQELLPQLLSVEPSQGRAYMQIQLTPSQRALLPLEYVQEALLVKSVHITHLPNVHPAIMGLMAARSRVFCAIDLAQLLNLSVPLPSLQRYHGVVVRSHGETMQAHNPETVPFSGLIVQKIWGMVRVEHPSIQSNSTLNIPALEPVTLGSIDIGDLALPLLDIKKIMRLLEATCPSHSS